MIIANEHADRGKPMQQADADALGMDGAAAAQRYLAERPNSAATPLHALPSLAADLGIGALYVKDEGFRLGLGSFKALGGAYAVACIVVEEAAKRLARPVGFNELQSPAVRAVAQTMTFACATDGNHGRSVAQGAQLVGAKSVIFVHAGVSDERIAAIARFGAEMVRVDGNYDDSVAQATETA
ncbi:pyridoxal-phosphate dependent enzyme, partial [Salmonella enterica subsp. enterica]|nr:pyridoxal-phosphate dependent enzyme [Salmonella enterica subsp. enterica serovar Enteritidis]